jgi:hypothetical protein
VVVGHCGGQFGRIRRRENGSFLSTAKMTSSVTISLLREVYFDHSNSRSIQSRFQALKGFILSLIGESIRLFVESNPLGILW